MLLWSALLFTLIGVCAESFFSVNLGFIAKALHLSDTFAGVTFLALGNGAPDLFSTWAAMSSGSPELAIGELIGAACFISTVIAGSIALLGPFYIQKVSFCRDASFLMLTALFLIPLLVTERLSLWQGLVMIAIYFGYVSCVVWYHWRSTRQAQSVAETPEEHFSEETTPLFPRHPRDHDPSRIAKHKDPSSLHSGNAVYKEMSRWRRLQGLEIEANDDYCIRPCLIGTLEYRHRKKHAKSQPATDTSAVGTGNGDEDTAPSDHETALGARHVYETLFPTLRDFGNRRSWHECVALCTTLPFLLMKITIPVADFDRKDEAHPEGVERNDWDRWLFVVQSYIAPQFIWILLWPYATDMKDLYSWLHPALFCIAGSSVFVLILLVSTKSKRPPKWSPLIALLGFGVSAYWLCTIANEVTAILKATGVILDVSEGILGFTLFAVGNSLDDYVADMTVSQHGHQVMALSACFGGPLLNILLGLGTSIVYVIIRNAKAGGGVGPILLNVDLPLLISTAVLAVTMAALIAGSWFRKWQMVRSTGIILICVWLALATTNVLAETLLKGFGAWVKNGSSDPASVVVRYLNLALTDVGVQRCKQFNNGFPKGHRSGMCQSDEAYDPDSDLLLLRHTSSTNTKKILLLPDAQEITDLPCDATTSIMQTQISADWLKKRSLCSDEDTGGVDCIAT
ncbi:hypothetical protein LTR78_010984 [Recurvomyces mirabilis]|uniref:Sodium/calcium exchanger membrane region domain-containing protein n=1 Tax=Recurvomyces mirabilis TaxID=574656 RepID=A0AAE0TLS8_9PEZI|nr:hypothetical protein LTR78_010984 [Recurvomyces mirabilis]KAK5149416.1 hypothetical protein LTS14_010958 [Recurvomyces mirabilis]